ncbi:hypothetical protein GCM10011316_26320 [Roseibium aquae]|uniref:Aminoglycoside phosphotransferase domain-containing protein n=1 Tax=Roseibium aquae TaxID=1323746 RepID=A0A916TLN9_9HYPH|nr:bifunctional aminoglycoside phosphotransferase/ATP-binding protein [Roseibium aquae]GGB53014.1 hypothetical protein GCM10011316_26320 [Roseibium aquae]
MTGNQSTDKETQAEVFGFLAGLSGEVEGAERSERIDTHANTVFLVGDKAYKVKRAVKFPFLDYSTLALREEACKREIAYNKTHAPQIYRTARTIRRGPDGKPGFHDAGDVVEWVVEMNRFDGHRQLDRICEQGPLSDDLADRLAQMMGTAHARAETREGAPFFAELQTYLSQNAEAFRAHPELFESREVAHLERQADARLASIKAMILRRGDAGLVRLCHGDAHTRNIVLIDGEPVLFDAIEFSDAIATNDVLYDLAFLLMDLWERDQRPAANRVFNRYMDHCHRDLDASGLAVLPFYMMMRAAIRAKIAASAAVNQTDSDARAREFEAARTYFQLAQDFLEPSDPTLVGLGGFSGTGKTTLAYALAPDLGRAPGARVLRTDVKRKTRLGLAETERAPLSAYTKQMSDAVYASLDDEAKALLAAGHCVIFDAVFSDEAERARSEAQAGAVGAGFCGLWLDAPGEVLKDRAAARAKSGTDASDADAGVIDRQLTYDLGRMTWSRIDASGAPATTLANARQALAGCGFAQSP